MTTTLTRGYCRGEQRETRWRFAGYATADAHENTIRPRAHYQSCTSCSQVILTLGGQPPTGVPDALGLCRAVLDEWMRKNGMSARAKATGAPLQAAGVRLDTENVLGELYAYVWRLYNSWDPAGLTFRSYATWVLRQRVRKYVGNDLGLAEGNRTMPRAHGASVSSSYDAIMEQGGLDSEVEFAGGRVSINEFSERGQWTVRNVILSMGSGYTLPEISKTVGLSVKTLHERVDELRREIESRDE